MDKISDLERSFYFVFLSGVCGYLQSYIWRFLLYAGFVLLGAWLAFRFLREMEPKTPAGAAAQPPGCAECEERRRQAANLRAWQTSEKAVQNHE